MGSNIHRNILDRKPFPRNVAWLTSRQILIAVFCAYLAPALVFGDEPKASGKHGASEQAAAGKAGQDLWSGVNFSTISCPVVTNSAHEIKGRTGETIPLSPFWAQETVGADLAKEFMSEKKYSKKVDVGVYDTGFDMDLLPADRVTEAVRRGKYSNDYHGTAVTNLIVGNGAYSTSDVTRLTNAGVHVDSKKDIGGLMKSLRDFTDKPARLVNVSMHFDLMDGFVVFHQLGGKSLVVTSAGNSSMDKVSLDKRLFKDHTVVVGSASPMGTLSGFSQSGEDVDIFAPSDTVIQTIKDKNDQVANFGGTSGATPLVTGSIGNVASILEFATDQQLKKILSSSASPFILQSGHPDSAGFLNSYRMVRLADLINQRCSAAKDKAAVQECISNNLEGNSLQDHLASLKKEGQRLYREAAKLFASDDCSDQKLAFKMLRKSFQLNPENKDIARTMASFFEGFKKGQYAINSGYYHSISSEPDSYFGNQFKEMVGNSKLFDSVEYQSSKARTQIALAPTPEEGLRKLISKGGLTDLMGFYSSIASSKDNETLNLIARTADSTTDLDHRRLLLGALAMINTPEAINQLMKRYETLDDRARMSVAGAGALAHKNPTLMARGYIDPSLSALAPMLRQSLDDFKFSTKDVQHYDVAKYLLDIFGNKKADYSEKEVKYLRTWADKIATENGDTFIKQAAAYHYDGVVPWLAFLGSSGRKALLTMMDNATDKQTQDLAAATLPKQYFLNNPKGDEKNFFPSTISGLLNDLKADPAKAEAAAYRLLYELPKDKVTPSVVEKLLNAGSKSSDHLVRVAIFSAMKDPQSNIAFRNTSSRFRELATVGLNDPNFWIKRVAAELLEPSKNPYP